LKKTSVILIVLFLLSLSACDNGNSNSKLNTISPADLNERESTIISTTSHDAFVFDYKIEGYKEVGVWVEKYESGKLVDDELIKMTTEINESNGTIILATSKTGGERKDQIYNIGVGDEGGTSSTFILVEEIKDVEDQSIISGQLADEKTLNDDNEENVLATIAYSDNGSTTFISNDFYEDPEANIDELNQYRAVYLLKAKFVK